MGPLGIQELIIIFVIALLVFGPKKLPELGKSLGKGLKEFKKATDDLKSNWDEQIKEVSRSVEDVKATVHDAAKDITKDIPNFYAEYDSPAPPPTVHEPAAAPALPAASSATAPPDAHTPAKAEEESKKEIHQA